MRHYAWRIACLALSLTAGIATLRTVGVETLALAGPAGTADLSLRSQTGGTILLVTDKVHKPKKGCYLCNNKGYCLDENDKESCQVQKNVIETTWGPGYTWKCRCSKKPLPASTETACCWPSDNPAAKTCGTARGVRNAAIINYPGKAIECGPYQ
jgi:hypothetical protein